ncbi:hypothetical protein JJQ58_00880 [Mammaliicoccus fleurettii]|uniref:Uncharacterized protein n=1 Tax=Mammaliicoccus fleurettii TaxID=150056 RepID=A0ABS5MK81_9STAP|nr:hypothetical protein [Mammaliicoccus fleurettii]MBL0846532.1 hypothetical protein [Mammaliicoccus fleurettii]MBS3670973.1 hypothetical protein [Mammaliicoccus fleurettii]MBS3696032.1 hypothetical protein [Mammaliicoccus fleurettii]
MVKFLIKKDFKDVHTGQVYKKGEEQEFTVKRVDEIEQNLDGSFLVRKEDKKKK